MKRIPLTQGQFAIVDDEDFSLVSGFKWMARKDKKTYYAQRSIFVGKKQVVIHMHRVILGLSDDDSRLADHKDGNGLNNTRQNLRAVTSSQSAMNRSRRKGGTSIYKGVSKNKYGQFQVSIWLKRKYICLGTYSDEIEAAKAYDEGALKHFGEFARLNFPPEVVSI